MSGTTLRGLIKLNDTLLLGPDPLGNFLPIAVKSIHRKRMPVKEVRGGQTASFALKKVRWSALDSQNRNHPPNFRVLLEFSCNQTASGNLSCLISQCIKIP